MYSLIIFIYEVLNMDDFKFELENLQHTKRDDVMFLSAPSAHEHTPVLLCAASPKKGTVRNAFGRH